MQFRTFLERRDPKLDQLIATVFPDFRTEIVGTTTIRVVELPNGHQLTFSTYRKKPNQVQIGFSIDRAIRASYGQASTKDVASNAQLMPGTLQMFRQLESLVKILIENGFTILHNPIDQRRSQLYNKIINKYQQGL